MRPHAAGGHLGAASSARGAHDTDLCTSDCGGADGVRRRNVIRQSGLTDRITQIREPRLDEMCEALRVATSC